MEGYLTGGSQPPGGLCVKVKGASPGPGEREDEDEDEEFVPTRPHIHAQGWNKPFGRFPPHSDLMTHSRFHEKTLSARRCC